MKRAGHLSPTLSAVLATVLVTACTSASDTQTKQANVASDAASTPASTAKPTSSKDGTSAPEMPCSSPFESGEAEPDEVLVVFACLRETAPATFHSFARPVDPALSTADRLQAAVDSYFAGPSPSEGAAFLTFAGPEAFNSVELNGSRAVIDINLDGVLSNTAARSSQIWTTLRGLAFQFPDISTMEPRYNGSCEAFGEAVEAGECLVALRDGGVMSGP